MRFHPVKTILGWWWMGVAAVAAAAPAPLQASDIALREVKLLTPNVAAGGKFDYNVVLKGINLGSPVPVEVGLFSAGTAVGSSWTVSIEMGRDALKVPDRRTAPTQPGVYTLRAWKPMPNGTSSVAEAVLHVLPSGGSPTPFAEYLPISRVVAAVAAQTTDASPAGSPAPDCPKPGSKPMPTATLFYAIGMDGVNGDGGYVLNLAVYGPLPTSNSPATLTRRREWTDRFPIGTDGMAGRVSVSLPSGSYILKAFYKGKPEHAMAIGFRVP